MSLQVDSEAAGDGGGRGGASSLDNLMAVDDHNESSKLEEETSLGKSSSPPTSTAAGATTSSTAYAFTGSSLPGGATANLHQKSAAPNVSSGGIPSPLSGMGNGSGDGDKGDDSLFECNICLDTAKDAVVSMCGHLYCWPCLHQWLETRPHRKLCPVCKAAISKEKVIPLYGRNSTKQEDPRKKVPPRPAGQRTEPESSPGFQGFSFGDGFHMSFGIGAFPFGYFTSSLNFGEPRPTQGNFGPTQYDDEQHLSKLFLYLAFLCIIWLMFT